VLERRMTEQESSAGLVFAGFRLDRQGLFRLDHAGKAEPVVLGSRALDLLHLLADHAGEVVAKDAIMAAVWPATAVEESNLTVQVAALRRVLDQGNGQRSCIQTVSGRGYRLTATLNQADAVAPNAPGPLLPDNPSIAVLPFANLSGDPEQDYFADGMVEEIITALSRIHWLFVIARNSSFTYQGRATDIRQIGHELGVRYVLQGSVRKADQRVRITGQLIDATTNAHIWADHFDGAVGDIFELQGRVASSVAGALEPRLQLAEIWRTRQKPSRSLTAYDFYLRAMGEVLKPDLEDAGTAVALLQSALAADPVNAPAASLLAGLRTRQMVSGAQLTADETAEAVKLARLAIETGSNDAEALAFSGYALAILDGDIFGARLAIDRALTLNTNSAFGWWASALIHCFSFRPDAAIAAIELAIRLSPLDPHGPGFKAVHAYALMLAGRHDEARSWIDRALHERPRRLFYLRVKVALCGYLNSDDASAWVGRLLELTPNVTISTFTEYGMKFLSHGTLAIWQEGFRRAGLPER
jgi:TolB-like protein